MDEDRRMDRDDGRNGRRQTDKVCPVHDLLWDHHDKATDEHRAIVCGKIAMKADAGEMRGIKMLLTILVTITCLVVAGQALWLKSDIGKIETTITRVHQRITDTGTEITKNANERMRNDYEQLQQLGEIRLSLDNINGRITKLENKGSVR